jgi:amidase
MDNLWGAFVPGPRVVVPPLGSGPLDGLRLAVKDLIDVQGVLTTGGNPDWAASHGPALCHALVVERLLEAGATVVGKTVTDELAFSLEGENAHHGTPCNPRAPDRLPGGSSSGSAVAVASGEADIALGTDTGGSVRVPAAFCGVFGFRPTHGRVSLQGVLPFAPGFDTMGWMATSGSALQAVGRVLLDAPCAAAHLRLHWATELAALAEPEVREAVARAARRLPMGDDATGLGLQMDDYLNAYATLQGAEIRETLGAWMARHRPRFGPNIAPRFAGIDAIEPAHVARWQDWRQAERERVRGLLAQGQAWVFPTVACPALPRHASGTQRSAFYATALSLNAVAGHAGLPQVTLPAARVAGAPVGLSVVGPPDSDLALLSIAASWGGQIPSIS